MIESYSLPKKKLTPHMFRHTFCKWMLRATNNDIEKVTVQFDLCNIEGVQSYYYNLVRPEFILNISKESQN